MVFGVEMISERRLAIDGFLHIKSRDRNGKTYWNCKKVRDKECKDRTISKVMGGNIEILKGPNVSAHFT